VETADRQLRFYPGQITFTFGVRTHTTRQCWIKR
jgi:hypothetical protein